MLALLAGSARSQLTSQKAPELTGSGNWINLAKPLTLNDLRGKLVLLDFFTDSCVNCTRSVPKLKRLEEKYGNALVVVSIHSAKYDREKDDCIVKTAVSKLGISNPVLNDPESVIWLRYKIEYWPTYVLINPSGDIVGQTVGDTKFMRLDAAVTTVLNQAKKTGTLEEKSIKYQLLPDKHQSNTLRYPQKIIASEATKNLYIADSGHHRILITTVSGEIIKVIGAGRAGDSDGTYSQARFNMPQGLALDENRLFVADTANNLIRIVDLKSETVSRFDGTIRILPFINAGPALKIDTPEDLCLVANNLYVAAAGQHQLWRLELPGSMAEVVAGTQTEGIKDGPGKEALLAQPSGITTDGAKLYFCDSESSSIRQFDLSDLSVKTLVGKGVFDFGDQDGPAASARLQHPLGLTYWKNELYFTDSLNNKIKAIDLKTLQVRTVAGDGTAGCTDGKRARFANPNGIARLDGKLYVADTDNDRIRVIDLKTMSVSTLALVEKPVSR